jgi:hypothetical protein
MPGRIKVSFKEPPTSKRPGLERFVMTVQAGADKPQDHLVVSGRDGVTLTDVSAPPERPEAA